MRCLHAVLAYLIPWCSGAVIQQALAVKGVGAFHTQRSAVYTSQNLHLPVLFLASVLVESTRYLQVSLRVCPDSVWCDHDVAFFSCTIIVSYKKYRGNCLRQLVCYVFV